MSNRKQSLCSSWGPQGLKTRDKVSTQQYCGVSFHVYAELRVKLYFSAVERTYSHCNLHGHPKFKNKWKKNYFKNSSSQKPYKISKRNKNHGLVTLLVSLLLICCLTFMSSFMRFFTRAGTTFYLAANGILNFSLFGSVICRILKAKNSFIKSETEGKLPSFICCFPTTGFISIDIEGSPMNENQLPFFNTGIKQNLILPLRLFNKTLT